MNPAPSLSFYMQPNVQAPRFQAPNAGGPQFKKGDDWQAFNQIRIAWLKERIAARPKG